MKGKKANAKLCFVKIDVGSKESLDFYRGLLNYFGYKIIDQNPWKYNMFGEQTEFLIYHKFNIDPRHVYWLMSDAAVLSVKFLVRNTREVNRFSEEFLGILNGMAPSSNIYSTKKGMRTLNFYNKEISCIFVSGGQESKKFFPNTKTKPKGMDRMDVKVNQLTLIARSEESARFYRDLLFYLGYKVITYKKEFLMSNGETNFIIYRPYYKEAYYNTSEIYDIVAGITAIFFKVENKKEVDKFIEGFLKAEKTKFRLKLDEEYRENMDIPKVPTREEGKYSVFFDTVEGLTVGIISNEEGQTPNKKCLCEDPNCAKCLLVNCKDDNCPVHTKELKAKRRKAKGL